MLNSAMNCAHQDYRWYSTSVPKYPYLALQVQMVLALPLVHLWLHKEMNSIPWTQPNICSYTHTLPCSNGVVVISPSSMWRNIKQFSMYTLICWLMLQMYLLEVGFSVVAFWTGDSGNDTSSVLKWNKKKFIEIFWKFLQDRAPPPVSVPRM
jgi:hypothetical protein